MKVRLYYTAPVESKWWFLWQWEQFQRDMTRKHGDPNLWAKAR